MKKMTITVLTFVMMLTFSMGTSMAKFGNSGNGGANANIENALNNGSNGNKFGLTRHIRRPLFHKFMHCVRKLEVSDETAEIIKGLLEDHRTAQKTQNESMKDALIDYWTLLMSPVLDETALAEVEEEIVNLKSDDLELRFNLAFAIRNLLSEEELEALSECFDINQEEDAPVEE